MQNIKRIAHFVNHRNVSAPNSTVGNHTTLHIRVFRRHSEEHITTDVFLDLLQCSA
ncbi:Uncharacterised protein [Vibrio cholerae]|nr:Uncharacterised protein [Vibrio cholerae]CSI78390.1 Uncharacterised protein [Vibrio cholerae]